MESEPEFRMPFNRNRSRSESESWCRPHYSYVRLRDYVPTMTIIFCYTLGHDPLHFHANFFLSGVVCLTLSFLHICCPLLTDLVPYNPADAASDQVHVQSSHSADSHMVQKERSCALCACVRTATTCVHVSSSRSASGLQVEKRSS